MRRALVLAGAALCVLGCKVDIQHGLDEGEANQILVTLERSGIPSRKEREEGRPPTWKIRVPSSEAARAWQVMREHELPRSRAKGFDVFGKGALVPSRTEERALYQQALSGEIARLLQAYPGIVDARVIVSVPEAGVATAATAKPSASVLVKHAASDSAFRATDVQALVAGAVPGLDAKDVAVVAAPLRSVPSAASDMAALGPFVVSSGSETALQIALGAGLGSILLLGGLVAIGAFWLRRTRARLRALEVAAQSPADRA